MLFLFIHYALDTPKHKTIKNKDSKMWFRVYAAAEVPKGSWNGFLCEKGTTSGSDTIVDFGERVNLGKDDIIEGTFIQTERTGLWNSNRLRVFTVESGYRLIDRSTLRQ